MKRRRKQKKGLVKYLFLLLSLLVLVEIGLVVYGRPDWTFIIREKAYGLLRSADGRKISAQELEQGGCRMREWSLEQLQERAEVVFEDSLLLINEEHHVPKYCEEQVKEYNHSGVFMNECIMSSYAALAAECKKLYGETLYVSSGYRTAEKQKELAAVSEENVAAKVGASEHQAGLALDVYFRGYAGKAILKCEAGRYLNQNCWKYGFIIRYPYGKTSVTDTAFEPWHIRYVGVPHAEIMYYDGLVLEEYMEMLSGTEYYRYQDYLIARQQQEPFLLPQDFERVLISKDNMDGYLITIKLQNNMP